MRIQVDFRSSVPIYLQVVEQVRGMIGTGELNVEDQLPTVRQMALDLRVNFNTIARAYRLLDEAGLISTQRGRGTYVVKPPGDGEAEHLRKRTLDELTQRYLAQSARLGFSPDEVASALASQLANWKAGSVPEEEND